MFVGHFFLLYLCSRNRIMTDTTPTHYRINQGPFSYQSRDQTATKPGPSRDHTEEIVKNK